MFYIVGVTSSCKRLAITDSLEQAEAYVGTLPACEAGIYYIDGPCSVIVQLAEPTIDDLPSTDNPDESED